jgi:methionyl aminopeptidase
MGAIRLKTEAELAVMRESASMAASVLREAAGLVAPGLSTADLDIAVGDMIRKRGGESAFLGYRKFPSNCCISVNEGVVHGIGDRRQLQFGDVVKLDIGVRYRGYIGDVAMSVAVGGCSPLAQKLMDVTVQALYDGISAARSGNRVTDISRAVQRRVESNGFSVVREFVGHGVGKTLHEDPQIPNYVDSSANEKLRPGMTIAIEPMVNAGAAGVEVLKDGWTVVTRDRQLSAHFEHTVLVTDGDPEILTRDGLSPLY